MDFSSSLNLFSIYQLKSHTTPIARMIGAALNWNSLLEFEKYIQSCFTIYYGSNIVKDCCFIGDFMRLLLRNISDSYFEKHKCFRDVRHLDLIFNYVNRNRSDIVNNIKVDEYDWHSFSHQIVLGIVNMSIECVDDNKHHKKINRRLQLLHECLTNQNNTLFSTYGTLCKSLIRNIVKMYMNSDKTSCLHDRCVLRLSDSILQPNESKHVGIINKIIAACD